MAGQQAKVYTDEDVYGPQSDNRVYTDEDIYGGGFNGEARSPLAETMPMPAQPSRSISDALAYGAGEPLRNVGQSLEVLGAKDAGRALQDIDAPEGYEPASASFVNPKPDEFHVGGFAPQYLPRAVVEGAGQVAGSIASRAIGAAAGGAIAGPPGAVAGALALPFVNGALQVVGGVAKKRAAADGRDEPSQQDMAIAWTTAAASGALDTIGAKYLPGGEKAVGSAVQALVKAFYGEFATEGAQSLVEQTGETIATPGGLKVDPKQALGEAIIGGAVGAGASGVASAGSAAIHRATPIAPPPTISAAPDVDTAIAAARVEVKKPIARIAPPLKALPAPAAVSDPLRPEPLRIAPPVVADDVVEPPQDAFESKINVLVNGAATDAEPPQEVAPVTPDQARKALLTNTDPVTGEKIKGEAEIANFRSVMRLIVQQEKNPLQPRQMARGMDSEASVLENIRRMGGVRTLGADGAPTREGQEIRHLLKDVRRPGIINNKTGVAPDRLREAFREVGWFGGREDSGADLQDFYDLIDREVREGRQYHPESTGYQDAVNARIEEDNLQRATDHIQAKATRMGVHFEPSWSYDDIDAAITEREAIQAENDDIPALATVRHHEVADEFDRLTKLLDPFERWDTANANIDQRSQEPVAASPDRAPSPEDTVARGEPPGRVDTQAAGGGGSIDAARIVSEPGAVDARGVALPQTIIPGAEQSEAQARTARQQRALAEMKARAQQSKMRRGGQESVLDQDGGMFSQGRGQSDLLAAAASPPRVEPSGITGELPSGQMSRKSGQLPGGDGEDAAANPVVDPGGMFAKRIPKKIEGATSALKRALSDAGMEVSEDRSQVSGSRYLTVHDPEGMSDPFKIRISDHPYSFSDAAYEVRASDGIGWGRRAVRDAIVAKKTELGRPLDDVERFSAANSVASNDLLAAVAAAKSHFGIEDADPSNAPQSQFARREADPAAPVFFSALQRAVEGVKMEKAPAIQWRGTIKNMPGVKKEQIDWSGVDQWLESRKGEPTTKAEVADFIRRNDVQVKEVEKGDGETKFGTGQGAPIPGGKNYRELLMMLPHPQLWVNGAPITADDLATPHGRDMAERIGSDAAPTFRSNHFEEPNVLAHARFDDREGPNGERILHVAEIQSDWHQKGRKVGYTPKNFGDLETRRREIEAKGHNATEVEKQEWADIMNRLRPDDRDIEGGGRYRGVPDAPFKTTWQELAFKRMLRYAAENGYDRLSWDTGDTNAERYDLSKTVTEIRIYGTGDNLKVSAWNGNKAILDLHPATRNDVSDLFGKEVAEKLLSQKEPKEGKSRALQGQDLKIGGSGMRGFYDKILVDFANKYVKKWGANVGEIAFPDNRPANKEGWRILSPDETTNGKWIVKSSDYNSRGLQFDTEQEARLALAEKIGSFSAPSIHAHSIAITPAMREGVMHGQPMFQKGAPSSSASATDNIKTIPGGVRVVITPELAGRRALIARDVRKRLDALNLGDVSARIVDKFHSMTDGTPVDADGFMLGKVMTVALDAKDHAAATDHEVIHGVRNLGLITDKEWAVLEKRAADFWRKKHPIDELYADAPDDIKNEEAVAFAFAKWATDARAAALEPMSVRRIFQKVLDALRAIGAALRGQGFNTPDRIFRRIDIGKVGKRRRTRDANVSRFSARPRHVNDGASP